MHNKSGKDFCVMAADKNQEANVVEIPPYNLFMMCQAPIPSAFAPLPKGFSLRYCRKTELSLWMRMQVEDELHLPYMQTYFDAVYAPLGDLFFQKCLFVCNAQDVPVGTCFVWRAYGQINTIHWYKVLPTYEGQGIGRALLSAVLKPLGAADYPVYLHTHPSCFRAIHLYAEFGFALLQNTNTGSRNNDLQKSLPHLERCMPAEYFARLRFATAPVEFERIIGGHDHEEF